MIDDPEFARLLRDFHPDIIHVAEESIYAMRPDLSLAYFNQGWMRFAERNGGEPAISSEWTTGRCVKDAIPPELRPFFEQNFAQCLAENRPWEHRYECSSADLYRAFVMTTYPLGKAEGLLVVNSLVRETSHDWTASKPLISLYRNQDGTIVQCCHCRRVRRCEPDRAWDWVPEWVTACPRDTSHGLCEPCFGYYYPKQNASRKGFPKLYKTGSEPAN